MSVNVTIAEGGQGRRMPSVSEVRTDNASGTDDWVPESDYLTGVKFISENGTYYAKDDGVQSWSKVTVNVPGAAAGITIPTIIGDYGIMVPTGETGECMPTPPEGLIPDDFEDPDIGFDIDDIDGFPSIEGIDPITGEDIVIGIDSEGNKIEETLPSSISIEHNPFKMAYRDGEHISLSGIRVYARKSDGTIWTSKEYPDGYIPLRELSYEPLTAEYDDSSVIEVDEESAGVNSPFYFSRISVGDLWSKYTSPNEYVVEIIGSPLVAAVPTSDSIEWIVVSVEQFSIVVERKNGTYRHVLDGSKYTYQGNIYYRYMSGTGINSDIGRPYAISAQQSGNILGIIEATEKALFSLEGGGASGTQTITVKWKRPNDKKSLTASYVVDVTSRDSSGSGSGASSGGGGGGGGTGGGAY